MYQYSNFLSAEIAKDPEFHKNFYGALEKLFATEDKLQVNTKEYQAKIFHNPKESVKYLLVKDSDNELSIYSEKVWEYNRSKPFSYLKDHLKKGEKIHEQAIITLPAITANTGSKKSLKELEILQKIKEKLGNLTPETLKMVLDMKGITLSQVKTTSSPSTIKKLSNYLVEKEVLQTPLSDKYLASKSTKVASEIKAIDDLFLNIDFFLDICTKHKLTQENPHVFNDLDNSVWLVPAKGRCGTGVAVQSQGACFYVLKESTPQSYSIYAMDRDGEGQKTFSELDPLVEYVSSTPPSDISEIDNMLMKIENGKITFVDNAWLYCFMTDVKYTRISLEQEYNESPQYPVDTNSYEYQKNYYHKRYGYGEFEFLTQALLTLGGGFDYDKKNERYIDSGIEYLPELLNYKAPADPGKIENFTYCYPDKLGNLNADWVKGLEYLVEVLKRDKPIPQISKTQNPAKDLEDTIEILDKHLKKQQKRLNTKSVSSTSTPKVKMK